MVKFVTVMLDSVFEFGGFGAHKHACTFHLFICLMNVMLSTYPLLCYFAYSSNSHVVFWVGNIPQIVNLGVPCALLLLNISINIFQCSAMRAHHAQISCFTLFFVLGALIIGSGYYVHIHTTRVAEELLDHCGQTPMTKRIETEWGKLNAFAQKCEERTGEWPEYLSKCRGFGEAFTNRVYVNYIEDLEYDFDCTGFCRFWAKPIFNFEAERGLRCATALGKEVIVAGEAVALPTILLGVGLVVVGTCLAGYDHL